MVGIDNLTCWYHFRVQMCVRAEQSPSKLYAGKASNIDIDADLDAMLEIDMSEVQTLKKKEKLQFLKNNPARKFKTTCCGTTSRRSRSRSHSHSRCVPCFKLGNTNHSSDQREHEFLVRAGFGSSSHSASCIRQVTILLFKRTKTLSLEALWPVLYLPAPSPSPPLSISSLTLAKTQGSCALPDVWAGFDFFDHVSQLRR